mmetsp:Transcript_7194/g.11866  ORF Transcript_7194/g.11866 Transcript_7194/m.11866 type:complete len:254 (+) Transcript_7194:1-762(+)
MGMLHQNSVEVRLPNPLLAYLEVVVKQIDTWSLEKQEEFQETWSEHVLPLLRKRRSQILRELELDRRQMNARNNANKPQNAKSEDDVDALGEEEREHLEAMEAACTDGILSSVKALIHNEEVRNWLFPQISGSIMLPLGWMINHSCEPNTDVEFIWAPASRGRKNGFVAAQFIPNRKLKKGEEILISYLSDSSLRSNVTDRERSLADYGFICKCNVCRKERSKAAPVVQEGNQQHDAIMEEIDALVFKSQEDE